MNRYFSALILSVSFSFIGQAQDVNNKSSTEPKSSFEVTINGKKYKVTEDEQMVLDTVLSKPTISIKLSPLKKFENASVAFEYPRHLSFDYEQDYGYKNWTLSGNNLIVMLFEIDAKTTLSALVDETVKKFGRKNCTVYDFQRELGGRMWNGKKINVTLIGQKLALEYFEITSNDFKSRFIYFQDSILDNVNSKEYEEGFKIIDSTITFKL